MQIRFLILFFYLFIISCSSLNPAEIKTTSDFNESKPQEIKEFILAAGDEININVWRNDSLQRTVKLDPAGFVSLPLVGEIRAEGMTVSQLRKIIARTLEQYIKQPHVDVNVVSIASKKVYILGEVRAPGSLVVDAPMTVWEALSRAGGFTNNANKNHVMVIRQENGETRVEAIQMDITKLYKDGSISNELYLQNRDILYIPENRISTIERFMNRLTNILEPILSIERGIILGNTVNNIFQNKNTSTDISISP